MAATSPIVKVEFKITNNGVVSSSTIIAEVAKSAKITSDEPKKAKYMLEVRPDLADQKIRLEVDAKSEDLITHNNQQVNSTVFVVPGVETVVASSNDDNGKEIFKLTAKATLVK